MLLSWWSKYFLKEFTEKLLQGSCFFTVIYRGIFKNDGVVMKLEMYHENRP